MPISRVDFGGFGPEWPPEDFSWYHVVLTTYGAWLPGDPRGFRTRHHREHVPGDYKAPPPVGMFVAKVRSAFAFAGGIRTGQSFKKHGEFRLLCRGFRQSCTYSGKVAVSGNKNLDRPGEEARLGLGGPVQRGPRTTALQKVTTHPLPPKPGLWALGALRVGFERTP